MNALMKNLVAGAGALALTSASAMAEEWAMPTPYAESHFHTRNIQMFADEIEEATDGGLVINVHPNGSLFQMPEIKRAVQTGQVPIGEINMAAYANENPYFAVDSIPFLATDYDTAAKLWELTEPKISEYLEGQNILPLYAVPFPPMGLISKTPIESRDDFKGMRFRAFGPTAARFGELLEATPTVIQAAEVAQAFSLGTVDAMLTSASTGVATQAWDYADYFIDMGQAHLKNLVIVNKEAFEGLSDEYQQIVLNAANNAEERGWELSREEGAATAARLAEEGMNVTEPSPEFAAEMQEVGNVMSEEWAEIAGPDGRAMLEELRE